MTRKVVIVTGASSGLGRGAAIKFAKEGWNVVISGRSSDELEKTKQLCEDYKVKILSVVADVTVATDVERIVEETLKAFSRLDTLVNNAGIAANGGIEDCNLEQFDRVMNTNLRAVFHLTKLAVPHLIASKGSIVNVSSVDSILSSPNSIAYSTSKTALDQLTKCLAMELAPKQVRVNSVNPAVVPTNIFYRTEPMSNEQLDEMFNAFARCHPLLRNGRVEEVADAIYFLASDKSSFTTGCQLPVDGGVLCTSSFYGFKPDL